MKNKVKCNHDLEPISEPSIYGLNGFTHNIPYQWVKCRKCGQKRVEQPVVTISNHSPR